MNRRHQRAQALSTFFLCGFLIGAPNLVSAQDADGDGVLDIDDHCPGPDGIDGDGDGIGAGCDCDDSNPDIAPGMPDVCDTLDNDCDGRLDVNTAIDLDGAGLIAAMAQGRARNPSARVFTPVPPTEALIEGGSDRDVYFRMPVELFGPRNRVQVDVTRFPNSGDNDFVVGLSDGQNVILAGLYNDGFSGERYLPAARRGRDRDSTLDELTPLVSGSPVYSESYAQASFTVVFEFDDAPLVHIRGYEIQRVLELPRDATYDLDPSLPWEVLLYAPAGGTGYLIEHLTVHQDTPHLDGGVDADGDGYPASCECDDTDPNAFPGAHEVCNGRDDDCDYHGDTITHLNATGTELYSDLLRGVATHPARSRISLDGTRLRTTSLSGEIFYRRPIEARVSRSLNFTPADRQAVFDLTYVLPADEQWSIQIGISDGTRVINLDLRRLSSSEPWLTAASWGNAYPTRVHTVGTTGLNSHPRSFFVNARIILREGANVSQIVLDGGPTYTIPTGANLDLSRPLEIIAAQGSRGDPAAIDGLVLTQPTLDQDGDGICNLMDRCVGPDGEDSDDDGVGAACDCDDTDARVYPGANEICDGLSQSCGAPDERVYVDVDGPGLLEMLVNGSAENSSGAPLENMTDGIRFGGSPSDIQFRIDLPDYDPSRPLDLEFAAPSGVGQYFPNIGISDGDNILGIGLDGWSFFSSRSLALYLFDGTDNDRSYVFSRDGESRVGSVVGPPIESAHVRIQQVAGQLEATLRIRGQEMFVIRHPWNLVPGRPLQLLLMASTSADESFRSLRVSQQLPDSDGDQFCDAIDQCPGFDDRVDGDGDGRSDFCDVCLGPDGPDLDADGYPAGCDCDDNNPNIHPGATDICDRIDQDCNGEIDLHVAMAARGMELWTQIGRGLASNPSGRRVSAGAAGSTALVLPDPNTPAQAVFYRAPLNLLPLVGGEQRFVLKVDREPLTGDHDLTLLISDGARAFGVGLFNDGDTGRRTHLAPVYGGDTGPVISPLALGEGHVLDEANPYTFQFVLGNGDPRIEVTSADGGIATLTVPAATVGALDLSALQILLVANGPGESYVIRSVSVTQPLPDSDGDLVCDLADRCDGVDDQGPDSDRDGFADACDICRGGDDAIDSDGDGVPNACDACTDQNDGIDADGDGVPDACDICPNDSANDSDGDMVCDRMDLCLPGDDRIDTDADGIPDACDRCPTDGMDDSDEDGTCDVADVCEGDDRTGDQDGDGFCADVDCDDTRASIYPNAEEVCDGFDSNCSGEIPISELDTDGDLVIDCVTAEQAGGCAISPASTESERIPGLWLLIGLGAFIARRRRRRR